MPATHLPRRTTVSDLPFAVPGVWHADSLGGGLQQAQPSGSALLDAQLPGGGWPVGALSEVLQPLPGLFEWQLVLPALAQATAGRAGVVVGVAPPHEPFAPALQARGLAADRLCLVRTGAGASSASSALWAAEQALRCRDVLAVMAWLPQVPPAALRRLQLAAAQQQQLLWVFRPLAVAPQASPAVLRLQVQGLGAAGGAAVFPGMQVQILKRRGPPLVQGLDLPGCHPRLAQALAAQARRRQAAQEAVLEAARGGGPGMLGMGRSEVVPTPALRVPEGRMHALDRIATATLGG
ncbi:translesion DNA synthesis-associated protein ImuA [Acidovorax sp. FJL06]|uniref:translesion DNA synthesis-associated protein ImuA n=1 Tax=Acidovorax sp. FJL06 TaxID=2153365 RepID=UPI000F57A7EE|nr:translesion DNA synthesis-associated protein ImuA [Acidovorax sp. FJL06]RQO81548.1 translesion DNA synthesis-associated protein ImuA [Acidovorax sp. FJL06]